MTGTPDTGPKPPAKPGVPPVGDPELYPPTDPGVPPLGDPEPPKLPSPVPPIGDPQPPVTDPDIPPVEEEPPSTGHQSHDGRLSAPESWPFQDSERRFEVIEQDFRRFEDENRGQPERWWDGDRQRIRIDIQMLRERLDELRHSDPATWDPMRQGLEGSVTQLSEQYATVIREIQP